MNRNTPFFYTTKQFHDDVLGWAGIKQFGDVHSGKRKILIVGDSFTQGPAVAPDKLYYRVLASKLKNAEFFVFAGPGYGTLQEYLVIDKYYDEISPELVILQAAPNDFINNSWRLENESCFNNNLMVRPYWENGRMVYRFPAFGGRPRVFLSDHSRIFYRIFNGFDKLRASLSRAKIIDCVEDRIYAEGFEFEDFARAVRTTEELLHKIKQRTNGSKLIVFESENSKPYSSEFKRICERAQILLIETVPGAIGQAESLGIKTRIKDGYHWNEEGHRICGTVLAGEVEKVLNPRSG